MSDITITTAELRAWCAKTIDVIEEHGHAEFQIPVGLYHFRDPSTIWGLPSGAPMVGDSSDDIVTLREELATPVDELVDWHSLEHLIGALMVVASLITPPSGTSIAQVGPRP